MYRIFTTIVFLRPAVIDSVVRFDEVVTFPHPKLGYGTPARESFR